MRNVAIIYQTRIPVRSDFSIIMSPCYKLAEYNLLMIEPVSERLK